MSDSHYHWHRSDPNTGREVSRDLPETSRDVRRWSAWGFGVTNFALDGYSSLHSLLQCSIAKGRRCGKAVFTLHSTARISKRNNGSLQ